MLTGAPVPGAGRHSVGAKSPLTGGFGESESGGFWGAELKRAGWDGIVVHGASPAPVYLWINDGAVEIRDAAHLWGRITGDVEEAIIEELGDPRIRVAQIGPGGENLVRFACIANDLNEVAGRTGLGAVMGSKRLKAIAVRGKIPVKIADPKGLTAIAKWVSSTMDQNHRAFHEFGTGAAMQGKSLEGGMPTLNYRLGAFEHVARVDAVAVRDQVRVQMKACYACSVRCKKVVHVEEKEEAARQADSLYGGKVRVAFDPKGRYRVDPKYGGPEYESLAALGVNLGLDDLIAICKSNEMSNYLGLDTVSMGATIAWAMECFEHGILTLDDTEGFPLHFHDADGVVKLIEMIAYRRGVGDLLAEGSQRAARRIGRGSEAFLTTVKGMEMAMHDPRHMPVMRASYLLAPTGGDHMRQSGARNGLRNQVGICHFLAYDDAQVPRHPERGHRLGGHPRGDGGHRAPRADPGPSLQPARGLHARRRPSAEALFRSAAQARRPHRGATGQGRHRVLRGAGLGPRYRCADLGDHPRAGDRGGRGTRLTRGPGVGTDVFVHGS